MDSSELRQLIFGLISLPYETEWVEFKHNKAEAEEIGQNISALSNSAALLEKPCGYIVWGIDDKTHDIKGTSFRPHETKVGNENLESWLLRLLDPKVDFRIHECDIDNNHLVVFEVFPAPSRPVGFKGIEFIRIGSYTKKLREFPEKERSLWRIFDTKRFEDGLALESVSSDDVLSLISYPKYFSMMKYPLPDSRKAILEKLTSERLIFRRDSERYDISNVGAILFARNLGDLERLARKSLRVILYKGTNRIETVKEQAGAKGYAVGFEGAVDYINNRLVGH